MFLVILGYYEVLNTLEEHNAERKAMIKNENI